MELGKSLPERVAQKTFLFFFFFLFLREYKVSHEKEMSTFLLLVLGLELRLRGMFSVYTKMNKTRQFRNGSAKMSKTPY